MSFQERWRRTVALWPYIAPLTLVYFAEYSMQVLPFLVISYKQHAEVMLPAELLIWVVTAWLCRLGHGLP